MDNADVIHRVLENKQSLLELHSADRAPFYFTYTKVVILINTSYKYNAASRSYTKFIFATWQSLVTSLKSGPSCRTGRPTLEICTHKDSWVSSSYSIVYPCWWNIWCVYVMFITHPIHKYVYTNTRVVYRTYVFPHMCGPAPCVLEREVYEDTLRQLVNLASSFRVFCLANYHLSLNHTS